MDSYSREMMVSELEEMTKLHKNARELQRSNQNRIFKQHETLTELKKELLSIRKELVLAAAKKASPQYRAQARYELNKLKQEIARKQEKEEEELRRKRLNQRKPPISPLSPHSTNSTNNNLKGKKTKKSKKSKKTSKSKPKVNGTSTASTASTASTTESTASNSKAEMEAKQEEKEAKDANEANDTNENASDKKKDMGSMNAEFWKNCEEIGPFRIGGHIVKGTQRGRTINCKTANLDTSQVKNDKELSNALNKCKEGVYIGWARVIAPKDETEKCYDKVYKNVLSIGFNPHFNNRELSIESHILNDFKTDFYHCDLKLIICGYIRPQFAFNSLDDLMEAIQKDIEFGSKVLDTEPYNQYGSDQFFS